MAHPATDAVSIHWEIKPQMNKMNADQKDEEGDGESENPNLSRLSSASILFIRGSNSGLS